VPDFDLIIRNATVVTPGEARVADVGVAGEHVVSISPDIGGTAGREIDATGRHVLPGLVDAHVHFNEPGRMEWEGIAHGSLGLAAGGATTFVDMPLNSDPPTLTAVDVTAKLDAARDRALIDFGLWGGLVPGQAASLRQLAEAGVLGFKAFMCESGIDEFPAADDETLRRGMQIAGELGLPVLVHAELDDLTRALTEAARLAGNVDEMADYIATRPVEAEVGAIQRAVEIAAEMSCRLHIVHVSSVAGVRCVLDGAARGVDVSCETCPQYLVLSGDDLDRLGADAKCAPPPRPSDHDGLWAFIDSGDIPIVASDHSPSPPDLKDGRPLLDAWGGIAGGQSTLGLMMEHGVEGRGIELTKLVSALSSNAAARFRLPGKGAIREGYDADLAIVDLNRTYVLSADDLFSRHARSPYLGARHRGRVSHTILRGTVVFEDGRPVARPTGRFLRPVLA
jgi:allantoinase